MSDDIKRYDFDDYPHDTSCIAESEYGEFVLYSDHIRTIQLLKMQLTLVEAYREDAERMVDYLIKRRQIESEDTTSG